MPQAAQNPLLTRINALEVPIVVRLGGRQMRVSEVTALVPGSIVELPKRADTELELLVNNHQIATGRAVKVGENFGLKISAIGSAEERARAAQAAAVSPVVDAEAEALAEALLKGQT